MSDTTTIARPYAKALFEVALAAHQLPDWSLILNAMAQAVWLPETVRFLNHPASTSDEAVQLLMAVATHAKSAVDVQWIERWVTVLAQNKRLLIIPAIFAQYEQLRAAQEKTVTVTVNSFSPLSEPQQQRLIDSLTKRLKRQVDLDIHIDATLLGGALIQAGDLVIDGSVRGQLLKLASRLAE